MSWKKANLFVTHSFYEKKFTNDDFTAKAEVFSTNLSNVLFVQILKKRILTKKIRKFKAQNTFEEMKFMHFCHISW